MCGWPASQRRGSAAVFPWRTGDRQWMNSLVKMGFDDFQYHHGVIAIFRADIHHSAFDVGREVLKDRRGGLPFRIRLTVERVSVLLRGREKFLRDFLLIAAENVQGSDAAF